MTAGTRKPGRPAVYAVSLGCPRNLVDTERYLAAAVGRGHRVVARPEEAQVLFLNTCAFLAESVAEAREALAQMVALKTRRPGVKLHVAGCLVSRFGRTLRREFPEIDRLYLPRELAGLPHRFLCTPGYYGYLKIAEGCRNHCSYCLIPSLRGPLHSFPPETLFAEAAALAAGGVRELNVIAQDTTAYGADLGRKNGLADMLAALCRIEGLRWVRLLYTYPDGYTEKLVRTIAENLLGATPGGKICPYLDLPLQHASDRILRAMNRRGRRAGYLRLIEKLRARIPGLVLRTTFIVGFPGETDRDFTQLKNFIRAVGFDKMGVFAFSPEPGTLACSLPDQVPPAVKNARFRELMGIQTGISAGRLKRFVGRTLEVLVEGPDPENPGSYVGRTCFDAPEVDGLVRLDRPAPVGAFVPVRVTGFSDYDLAGEVTGKGI